MVLTQILKFFIGTKSCVIAFVVCGFSVCVCALCKLNVKYTQCTQYIGEMSNSKCSTGAKSFAQCIRLCLIEFAVTPLQVNFV